MDSQPPTQHCHDCRTWKKSAFYGLSKKNLDFLASEKISETRERGETFSRQGEPADQVYCIRLGQTKVTHTSTKLNQQSIIRIATEGDLLGYRCVFSEKTFRATASSLGPSMSCRIPKSFMFQMIESDPGFSREMLKRMGQEIAASESHHSSFCHKNVRERMAEALLILKQKCGVQTEKGWLLNIQLTRNELANRIGTAKETAIRCLTDFKEENLIEQKDDAMILLNIEKLIEISS